MRYNWISMKSSTGHPHTNSACDFSSLSNSSAWSWVEAQVTAAEGNDQCSCFVAVSHLHSCLLATDLPLLLLQSLPSPHVTKVKYWNITSWSYVFHFNLMRWVSCDMDGLTVHQNMYILTCLCQVCCFY